MLPLLIALSAAQSSSTSTQGQIGYAVDDVQLNMGDLHLAAGAGVSILGRDQRVFVSGTALAELAPWFSVHSMGTFAVADLDDDGGQWFHAEAGVAFHGTKTQRSVEDVLLEQNSYTSGDTRYTNTNTARMPVLERSQVGLNAGAIVRQGRTRLGKEDSGLTQSTMLLPYAGVFFSSGVGQSARIEGYGTRSVYRFMWVGADVVYAGPSQSDVAPTGELNDFGLRFHTNASFGRPGTIGLGGRLEVGALPGGLGGYLLASGAVTTNLRVFGTRSGRSRSRPSSSGGKKPKK